MRLGRLEQDPGAGLQGPGLGMWGQARRAREEPLRERLSFQIQAYDPELWVWGRDRALLA